MSDSRRGLLAGSAVLVALVALDVALGNTVNLTGTYMLAAFVAAVLGDMRGTVAVSAGVVTAGLLSSTWNHDFGHAEWVTRSVLLVVAAGFALAVARGRERVRSTLRQQRLLARLAELPDPSQSLEETAGRVSALLVPHFAEFAAVDALRGEQFVRLGSHGSEYLEGRAETFDTPLRARGRLLGRLTVARNGLRYTVADREFIGAAAGRVALVLDNAGLSRELLSVEQKLDAILSNLGEAVTVQDRTGALVYANQAAAELLGATTVDELISTPPIELLQRFVTYNTDGTPLRLEQLPGRHVLQGEEADPLLVRAINRNTGEERWRLTKSTAVRAPDGEVLMAVNIIEDVTEAKRTEIGQGLLAEASAVLASSLDYQHTLQQVAELAVPDLADWCSVSIPRGALLEPVAVAHGDPDMVDWARRYTERYPSRLDEPDGAPEVLRSGVSQIYPEITQEMLDLAPLEDEQREALRELGMRSVMVVPMITPEGPVGVISMVSAESGRRFGDADLRLAEELGRRAGTALENARLYTELADVAQTLQRGLAPPQLPDVPGWSFRSLYTPASGETDVGGDFYDVFPTAAGWMAVIGDVVGRGAAAASLTAMARYTLRTAGSLVGTPTMGLARLNENLRERGEMALCTAAVVLLRDDSDEASIVCAGHPLPYLVRDGRPEAVGRTGPLLGAFERGHWLPAAVSMERGDVLVLFTDGVIDARSSNGAGRFGDERLRQTLEGVRSVEDAVRRIRSAIDDFAGGAHTDDTAVLAIQRL